MESTSTGQTATIASGAMNSFPRKALVIFLFLGLFGCNQPPVGSTNDVDNLSCDDQKNFAVLRANAELERIPKNTNELSVYACGVGLAITVLTLGADVGTGAAIGCGAAILVATADATQNAESRRYSVLKAHYEMMSPRCRAEMETALQAELLQARE